MNVTTSPAPKSSVALTVELPSERLDRAVDDAVRRLSRRTRVAGFRPGKAPRAVLERVIGSEAVMEEAVEHLVSDAYRAAIREQDLVPLTDPDIEVVKAVPGEPVVFTATVQVRPDVVLGDYRAFNFRPEIEAVDDAKVATVLDELRDQNAALDPTDGPAKKGDYAIIAYRGTRDGEPFEGGSTDRMPLIIGDERLIPGFEDHLVGLRRGESTSFDIEFPADYVEPGLAGATAHFEVDLRDLRAKVPPELDDDFARSMGDYADLGVLREDVRRRLERNALDRARHGFSDRIIDYAVANSTLDLPDVLVDQEVEVMHDELRGSLARQGITEEAYLKVVKQTEADLHADLRPRAEGRVRTLLVLSKIAEAEGVTVDDTAVEAEIATARERYRGEPKLLAYFESDRGRSFIRSTLRRSLTVERLVDEWLAAHPDHPPIPHAEEAEPSATTAGSAAASAAVGATDPDSIASTSTPDRA